MIVVSDTTPLIGLASIDRLELLHTLFGEVNIPQAVFDETVTFGREGSKAKQEVSNADWIHIIKVKDRLAINVLLDEMDLGGSRNNHSRKRIKRRLGINGREKRAQETCSIKYPQNWDYRYFA